MLELAESRVCSRASGQLQLGVGEPTRDFLAGVAFQYQICFGLTGDAVKQT